MATEYPEVLQNCPLFAGIQAEEIEAILHCLSSKKRSYAKNMYIYSTEESVSSVGLIVSGSVHIIREDYWGNRDILGQFGPGELFAESFSCAQMDKIPVSVVSAEETEILLIDCRKIIRTCSSACLFHSRLIQNMLQILARKNIALTQKLEQMAKRTTREKLLAYLSAEAQKAGSNSFMIPFNRQELADYLSVDRRRMSAELSKMRSEGLLDFDRSRFALRKRTHSERRKQKAHLYHTDELFNLP